MDVVLCSQSAAVLGSAFLAVYVLLPAARRTGFVDRPNHRKLHGAPVPLIGGAVVFIGLMMALWVSGVWASDSWQVFLVAGCVLTTLGIADDRFDLSARWRFLLQGAVVAVAGWVSGVYIQQLGVLLGGELLTLGVGLGLMFTVVCALASINAYNMIDGIDGLAGLVTMITLLGITVLSFLNGATGTALMAGLPCLALLVYLLFNLELPFFRGKKIFLGDGGSTFLGFLVLWLLVVGTQQDESFRPIAAVWLVGLPIVDMLTVFARRALAGQSPFSADRIHIHHLLMRRQLSSRQALLVLVCFQSVLVGVGLAGELLRWSEASLTLSAIGAGCLYATVNILLSTRRREGQTSSVRN